MECRWAGQPAIGLGEESAEAAMETGIDSQDFLTSMSEVMPDTLREKQDGRRGIRNGTQRSTAMTKIPLLTEEIRIW
jgi:hypothetical protein